MTPLLRFEGVTCRRGGQLLFEELSLALQSGDALRLVGPNGTGKSSLIRIAAGLLRPERGRIETAPVALADDSLALDPELPLRTALAFWGGAVGDAMESLGIAGLSGVPVRLLSAGQAKRAALARVAASGAPLWLLDEPANGLDAGSIDLLGALVDRHRSTGGAVLCASHSTLPGEWRILELGA